MKAVTYLHILNTSKQGNKQFIHAERHGGHISGVKANMEIFKE